MRRRLLGLLLALALPFTVAATQDVLELRLASDLPRNTRICIELPPVAAEQRFTCMSFWELRKLVDTVKADH